jgi:hypothetical protein
MRPSRPGPWTLDKVKKRLRAEQVQRETLASARYRLEEDQGQEQEAKASQSDKFHSERFSSLPWFLLSSFVTSRPCLV